MAGTVFQDHNADGVMNTSDLFGNAVDAGLGGVTVRAYDRLGALVGTAVSATNGTHTLEVARADTATDRTVSNFGRMTMRSCARIPTRR